MFTKTERSDYSVDDGSIGSTKMKKVLIVSYFFPPDTSIGAQRPYGLSKYLPEFGWEPIILTVRRKMESSNGTRIIETDYEDVIKLLKSKLGLSNKSSLHEQLNIPITKDFNYPGFKSKFIKFCREIYTLPDDKKGWYKYAINSASALIESEKIDVIMSTSCPETCHLIASKLKQRYNIPWIADFRDLWTQNHYYGKYQAVKYIERKMESKILSGADALVTVSEPLADILRSSNRNKKVKCVTNGYDENDFPKQSPELTKKFTITYTGTLYSVRRDPALLFKVIRDLITEKKMEQQHIELRFFMESDPWLSKEVSKYGLDGVVTIHGFLPRKEALKKQQESQVLLLLLWNNPKETGVYTGKVFEYLGSRRPIISVGGKKGVVKSLLDSTESGKFTVGEQTLREALLQYYQEFRETGEVKNRSNLNIQQYSYKSIAQKYAGILNEVSTI